MNIDYDILAKKVAEQLVLLAEKKEPEKKLTGRAYWAALRKDKSILKENVIPPESAYDFHRNCDSCERAKAAQLGR